MLRLLSIAELVAHVKEVMLVVSLSLHIMKESHILLVSNTLLRMVMANALIKRSARTAPGHHAQRAKRVRTSAGLLRTLIIMRLTTTVAVELIR